MITKTLFLAAGLALFPSSTPSADECKPTIIEITVSKDTDKLTIDFPARTSTSPHAPGPQTVTKDRPVRLTLHGSDGTILLPMTTNQETHFLLKVSR